MKKQSLTLIMTNLLFYFRQNFPTISELYKKTMRFIKADLKKK
jgi:hypothetical protein